MDTATQLTRYRADVPAEYYHFAPLEVKSAMDPRSAFVRRMVAPKANDDEWAVFVGLANAFQLNPLMNPCPLWCIPRRSKGDDGQWVSSNPPQLGIAAYRIFAARSGEYGGASQTQWCGEDGRWDDVWLPRKRVMPDGTLTDILYPSAARVGVWRTGFREPQWGVAVWAEAAQYHDVWINKRPVQMLTNLWQKWPSMMLAKVAEKQALTKAFPEQIPEDRVGRFFSVSEPSTPRLPKPPIRALTEAEAIAQGALLYPPEMDESQGGDDEGEHREEELVATPGVHNPVILTDADRARQAAAKTEAAATRPARQTPTNGATGQRQGKEPDGATAFWMRCRACKLELPHDFTDCLGFAVPMGYLKADKAKNNWGTAGDLVEAVHGPKPGGSGSASSTEERKEEPVDHEAAFYHRAAELGYADSAAARDALVQQMEGGPWEQLLEQFGWEMLTELLDDNAPAPAAGEVAQPTLLSVSGGDPVDQRKRGLGTIRH